MMFSFSPKLFNLLIQTTEANDLESALQSVLSEYLQLKPIDLEKRMKIFETKWDGDFFQFQDKIKNKTLGVDSFSYEVECDYWEWEDTLTLIRNCPKSYSNDTYYCENTRFFLLI